MKSFREQIKECKEANIQLEEKCFCCGHLLFMCREYGGFCHSGKCRDERVGEKE